MKQLKTVMLLLLALNLGVFFSCNNDDNEENNNSNAATIIGNWELTSITSNGEELIENPDCLDRIIITALTYDYLEYFDFDDGNGCVLVDGQVLNPEEYTLNGNILLVTDADETFEYEIIELNSTTLKLQETYIEDDETFIDIETYNKL